MKRWMMMTAALSLVGTVVLAAEAETTRPADWSQWRGPSRDGKVHGPAWPASFDGLTRLWRVPLGKGYPGPIVSGDRVFVVESLEDENASVRALHVDSGEEIWKRSWDSSGKVPFFAARNGDWIRSTPAWDGSTLYVGDMREVLMALDGDTGDVRWQVDLPSRFETPVPDFGFASSPLVDEGFLYVQAANSLIKLDTGSGETVWRSLHGDGKITASGAFSSPIVATLAGVRQLVVQTRMTLFGVSLEDGSPLWSIDVPHFRGMNILTPVVHGDSVLTSSYRNGTYLFTVERSADTWQVNRSWENKATGYMSSPVVVDGHAYLHLGNGRVDCIDLKTGESRWRSEPMGDYWSMVAQGNRILGLAEDGTLHLLEASSRSFTPLASHSVSDEETWGHVAIRGNRLFIRELTGITVWDWNPAAMVARR